MRIITYTHAMTSGTPSSSAANQAHDLPQDSAMSQRPWVLHGVGLSIFLISIHVVSDAFTSMLAALLPSLQTRFGLSETVLAMLVAMKSFSSSVTQPFFGALADRLGRRMMLVIGVLSCTVLLSLMGVAPSVFWLFALLLVGGFGSAAFHPAGTSLMTTSVKRENRGLAIGLFSAGGTLGLAIGPVAILYVVANYGLEASPWLMLPGVLLGLAAIVLIPKQQPVERSNRPKLFDISLFRGPLGWLCLSGILRSVPFVSFINAAPLWLVNVHGVARDAELIGWTLAAFSFSAGLGGIIVGSLTRFLSRQVLISLSTLLAALPFYTLFWLTPGTPLFFLMVILAGALVNGGLPLMVVSAQELAPHAVGTASGMLMGLTWGTAGLLYIGIGRLQEIYGISTALGISFMALVPAAALAFYVVQRQAQGVKA